ncbi:hypothetical protein B0H13DRAFT_2261228 [Mycena leptocephala]|nr:hypothetical protein B0H13DRAFT_2261228 [Mycena leptocephala]
MENLKSLLVSPCTVGCACFQIPRKRREAHLELGIHIRSRAELESGLGAGRESSLPVEPSVERPLEDRVEELQRDIEVRRKVLDYWAEKDGSVLGPGFVDPRQYWKGCPMTVQNWAARRRRLRSTFWRRGNGIGLVGWRMTELEWAGGAADAETPRLAGNRMVIVASNKGGAIIFG